MSKRELNMEQIENASGGIIGGLAGSLMDFDKTICEEPDQAPEPDTCICIFPIGKEVKAEDLADAYDVFSHKNIRMKFRIGDQTRLKDIRHC